MQALTTRTHPSRLPNTAQKSTESLPSMAKFRRIIWQRIVLVEENDIKFKTRCSFVGFPYR